MQTDKEIYLLLRSDEEFLRILCGEEHKLANRHATP